MKRRLFVKSSLLTTSISSLLPMATLAGPADSPVKKAQQEFYELRTYLLKTEAQQKLIEAYFEKAAIPALNRAGSKKVGVFTEMKPEGQTRIFVLIPHASVEDFTRSADKLMSDAAYQSAAAEYLQAPAAQPAYDRIESSLLKAFQHMPALEAPEKKQRMFELRRYESASEAAGKKKIEMFNIAEIDIFRRTGLTPVFFGETIIGPMRPNLTYMITFDDMDEHNRNWKQFGSDPDWKKISGKPEYKDSEIVSRITSTFLQPTAYSQV